MLISYPPYIGNVYIADAGNQRVRKVTISSGIITTLAGTGSGTYSGDNGPASSAAVYVPCGIRIDSSGTHHSALLSMILFLYVLRD